MACKLVSRHNGDDILRVDGPILVIGGGPSVPDDLRFDRHIDFKTVISANEHGFIAHKRGLCPKPDYILCGDHINSETRLPQEPKMRAYGVPLISRHGFADYQLDKDTYRMNSGQSAIVAACLMGGSPIYVAGIDCWIGEATYFHNPSADVVCRRQHAKRLPQQLETLRELTKGHDIRPRSGLLTLIYGTHP